MVEQWSSKPYAWVRFLLSLFITIISKINIKKKQNLIKSNSKINKRKNKKLSLSITKMHKIKLLNIIPHHKNFQRLININIKNRNKNFNFVNNKNINKHLNINLNNKLWSKY